MLNRIVKIITGKEIVLYDRHRQTEPIVNDLANREKYLFLEVGRIWSLIPFRSADKRKHRIMYILLNCIAPKYIISIHWISIRESLYIVWTGKHPKSRFVVIQHGAYAGGIVTAISHRYTKCDIFWVWGEYFEKAFKEYNKGKRVKIINLGNPIYNASDRNEFTYSEVKSGKILLLPTALDEGRLKHFLSLVNKLKEAGFETIIKTHGKQGREKDKAGNYVYPPIEGAVSTATSVYEMLRKKEFDFIISDHSTTLLDAIYFKNKVLYFDTLNGIKGYNTYYSEYLPNLFLFYFKTAKKEDFYAYLDIEKQEELFQKMITICKNKYLIRL